MTRKFYRTREGRVFAGVASGLGEYFDVDPVFIRLAFIITSVFGGMGLILYLVLAIVSPMRSERRYGKSSDFVDAEEVEEDEKKKEADQASEASTFSKNASSSSPSSENTKSSKSNHVFGSLLGVMMLLIGVAFLLRSFGFLWFSWQSLFYLWPLIIMLMGVSMIRMRAWLRTLFFLLIILAGCAILAFRSSSCLPWWGHSRSECIYIEGDNRSETTVSADLSRDGKRSTLEVSVGATSLTIDQSSKQWLEIFRNGTFVKSLDLSQEAKQSQEWSLNGFFPDDKLALQLHPECIWNLDFDCGAADLDLDLRNFLIEEVDLTLGAASAEITLGDRHPSTKVEVSAGVASVKLRIPESSGCEVFSNTVMSNRDYRGFIKEKGRYVSSNFDTATKIVRIYIDGAMNSLELERY